MKLYSIITDTRHPERKHPRLSLKELLGLVDFSMEEVDKISAMSPFSVEHFCNLEFEIVILCEPDFEPKIGEVRVSYKDDSPLYIRWITQKPHSKSTEPRLYVSFELGTPSLYGKTPDEQIKKVFQDALRQWQ